MRSNKIFLKRKSLAFSIAFLGVVAIWAAVSTVIPLKIPQNISLARNSNKEDISAADLPIAVMLSSSAASVAEDRDMSLMELASVKKLLEEADLLADSTDSAGDDTAGPLAGSDAGGTVELPYVSAFILERRESFPNALPESEPVVGTYFDDAIFFGDSISTGIPLYGVMPNAKVIAYTGVGTVNALTAECIDTDNGRMTMLNAAKELGDKKKVYIMLGSNAIGYDKEIFINGYVDFVGAVKEQYPGALIYIQSMTPVTDYVYKTYPSLSNKVIEEYNWAIHDMAGSEGVYYLDVAEALMDENGELPAEASPADGLHFTPEFYEKWFAYLKSHVAEQEYSDD